MTITKTVPISKFFSVHSGDFHAVSELEIGNIPLVSCGETNNGVIGTFDVPLEKTYESCLTVAFNGSWPLLTKYHPYQFGAKDDVGVLVPKEPLKDSTLLYIAAVLTRESWRYSYGRKCYLNKIPYVSIPLPFHPDGELDEEWIQTLVPRRIEEYIPKSSGGQIQPSDFSWKRFPLTSLFEIDHGDFNSYKEFPKGKELIVSRSAENNGVAGLYEPPEHARRFPIGTITVSTVTGDAFVQLQEFYASDKVVICTPKFPLRPTSLFFIAFSMNHQRWRYSYGRSCFNRTISLATIDLPDRSEDPLSGCTIDEDAMASIVRQHGYWPLLAARFPKK